MPKPTQPRRSTTSRKRHKTVTAAAKAPQTLETKLAAARALVAKYEQQIAAAAIVNNVEAGDDIDFTYGRAEKKRTLKGTITALKDDDNGVRWLRVLTGEGFEAETLTIRALDITENRTAASRSTEQAPVANDADPMLAA